MKFSNISFFKHHAYNGIIYDLSGFFSYFEVNGKFTPAFMLTMILSSLTVFSLFGIVITSYIGSHKEGEHLLYDIKKNKLSSKEAMRKDEEEYNSFIIISKKEEEEEFSIYYQGRNYGI